MKLRVDIASGAAFRVETLNANIWLQVILPDGDERGLAISREEAARLVEAIRALIDQKPPEEG